MYSLIEECVETEDWVGPIMVDLSIVRQVICSWVQWVVVSVLEPRHKGSVRLALPLRWDRFSHPHMKHPASIMISSSAVALTNGAKVKEMPHFPLARRTLQLGAPESAAPKPGAGAPRG